MKMLLQLLICVLCIILFGILHAESQDVRPSYSSQVLPDDSGSVTPVPIRSEKHLRIAVIGLEDHPFWYPVREGVFQAAQELKPLNVSVEWVVPEKNVHDQEAFNALIASAIEQKFDAIATIADNRAIVPLIEQASEAGIPVATFNCDADVENPRLFYVGADSYLQGQTAGQAMLEFLGEPQGEIAVITCSFDVVEHELRRKGLLDYLEEHAPEITVVEQVETLCDEYETYVTTQGFLKNYPNLDGIYVTTAVTPAAASAVEDAGMAGEIVIIGYDFIDDTMEYVKKGVIAATIGQQPFAQGHDPVIRLFNYLVGGIMPPAGKLITRSDIVTQENIDRFWKKD